MTLTLFLTSTVNNFVRAARRTQDFEKAGSLRDREMELKTQIGAITGAAKEESAAEAETEGVGPLVTDQDIANIVAQWTGIPVEKVPYHHTSFDVSCECAAYSPGGQLGLGTS